MRPIILLLITLFTIGWSDPTGVQNINYTRSQGAIAGRISSTPDYYQRDTAYGAFPGNGAMYCGPAAVSNSLMWLSDNGFPSLVPSSGDRYRDQHSLISELGSKEFMNTRQIGSTVQDLCRGIKKYLQMQGLSGKIVSEGMYDASREFKSDKTVPDYHRIKTFTTDKRAAWLNIGWYKYDSENDTYTKSGGHWVTLVGFSHDDKTGKDFLIIHDPDTKSSFNEYLSSRRDLLRSYYQR